MKIDGIALEVVAAPTVGAPCLAFSPELEGTLLSCELFIFDFRQGAILSTLLTPLLPRSLPC